MRTIDGDVQAQVDAQLLEQGIFAPLEWLFSLGRLSYGDYESWRRGEIDSLDSVLMGSPERIRVQLAAAAAYASRIGLVEKVREFHGWRGADTHGHDRDRRLRVSSDPRLARLIAVTYERATPAPQLDLFFDNPVVARINGIVNAVAARNRDEAQRHLDGLYAQAPNHADLAAFDRLVGALGHLGCALEDPRRELEFLLETAPLAQRLMGLQSRDLLTPLWRQLADALAGQVFSPGEPALHRSFALSQAQDWPAVAECVLVESGWWAHAPLCLRLARSGFHRQDRGHNLMGWFQLCWHWPQLAAESLGERAQPDASIAALWGKFVDSDAEGTTTAADFPAWMLLAVPGLAQWVPAELPAGASAGENHYRCVHRWIHARRAGRREEEMTLRKALQAQQPFLFEWLKRTV